MIAIDTNVLLRLVLRDNNAQAATAAKVLRRAAAGETPLFVSDIVLCEFAWVLRAQRRFARGAIANALREIIATAFVRVRDEAVVTRAVERYATGPGGFADYLIAEQALAAGAGEVVTFDKALRREAGFRLLPG